MTTSSLRSWRHLFAIGALTFTAVGCSASGGNDTAGAVVTTVAPGPATTDPGDPVPTTDADPGPTEVTIADLESILPTAREVGSTFEIDEEEDDSGSDTGDDKNQAALDAACPGVSDLVEDDGGESESAKISLQDADNRVFEISLDPEPDPIFQPDAIDDFVEAVNDCDTVTYTDDGWDFTIDLEASRSDDLGDAGITLVMDLTLDREELDSPLQIGYLIRSFLIDTVSVTVSTSDGLDDVTYETIPRDESLVDEFSAEMATRVTDLLAG